MKTCVTFGEELSISSSLKWGQTVCCCSSHSETSVQLNLHSESLRQSNKAVWFGEDNDSESWSQTFMGLICIRICRKSVSKHPFLFRVFFQCFDLQTLHLANAPKHKCFPIYWMGFSIAVAMETHKNWFMLSCRHRSVVQTKGYSRVECLNPYWYKH